MKIICHTCNRPLTFKECVSQEEPLARLIFRCGQCGHSIAMEVRTTEMAVIRALGMEFDVAAADASGPAPPWEEDARERLAGTPAALQPIVERAVNAYARKIGAPTVTTELMDRAKSMMMGATRGS